MKWHPAVDNFITRPHRCGTNLSGDFRDIIWSGFRWKHIIQEANSFFIVIDTAAVIFSIPKLQTTETCFFSFEPVLKLTHLRRNNILTTGKIGDFF